MDNRLLSDESTTEYIKSQIGFYLVTNNTPDISRQVLWEAMKAFICGQIISYSVQLVKKQKERKQFIKEQLLALDHQYATGPDPDLLSKRISLQTEFNLLSTSDAVNLITQSQHKFYEHREKPGRMLAHQIRASIGTRLISEIRTDSGNLTTEQMEINEEFKMIYVNLYTTESDGDISLID